MKNIGRIFAVVFATCALSTSVFANAIVNNETKVEEYAHPSMFGSEVQILTDSNSAYVTGGKILKSKNRLGVTNKDSVYVSTWSKDILALIREKQMKAGYSQDIFNPKMPILRSELAVVLAEGLNVKTTKNTSSYSDIPNGYWAKDWIYRVSESNVMIGYPSGVFKPDQPVTKAEVFATIAQQINVKFTNDKKMPVYKGMNVKYIPTWAYNATKEVINSGLLDEVPNTKKMVNDEYLSKEQVAYIVGTLRKNYSYSNALSGNSLYDKNAKSGITSVKIALLDRLSAKHSNIGDAFTAKTLNNVIVDAKTFPAGSIVRGEVIDVKRPGFKNPGYIRVKFNKIKNGDCVAQLPTYIAKADATCLKQPNFVARLFGLPFTGAARVMGVAGRTGAGIVNVAANSAEQAGDNLGNTFVETLSMHPGRGMASFGNTFATTAKGVYDASKLLVSGAFGVMYEISDEIVYCIMPSLSNSSSLNPGEELNIVF